MKPLYKYFPVFIALLVIAILSTGLYGATVVRTLFYERISVDLEDTARILKNLLLAESPDAIDLFCKTAGTRNSRITVIDRSGQVLGDSIADPEEMDNHGNRPEIKRAFFGTPGNTIRYSDTLQRNMMYLALPSFSLGDRVVVLRTATPLGSLKGDLRSAYVKIAVVGAIILILVSLLGIVLVSRVNGALHIIQNAVHEYAKGNLSFRPHIHRPPELKKVADTISHLAQDLRNRAGEASRQRDELEAVFTGMEEAVIVLDFNLVIRDMNDAAYRLTDVQKNRAVGKELLLVFRNSSLYSIAEQVRDNKQTVNQEIVLLQDKDLYLQVHGSTIPGTAADGEGRVVLVLNDVTKMKQLEQVRKDFVANVSHELKTPITAVKGYVETLLGGEYKDPKTTFEFLEIVHRQTDRLIAIIEDLLIISRIEQNGGIETEMAPTNLADIVDHVSRTYEKEIRKKQIHFIVNCPPDTSIFANPTLMEQAVANLVDNAVKFSKNGGTVEVSVTQQTDTTTIEVADKGPGIPMEHLDRIFERFYRIDKGRSRETGGTGLGLSIVKHISIAHKGRVMVNSTVGEGSTFSIILPGNSPSG